MNALRLALCVLLTGVVQTASAVQLAGVPRSSQPGPGAGEPIERGGNINAIDRAKAVMVVDGVRYSIPAGSVRIHPLSGAATGSLSQLNAGMQIRFTTVQPYPSSPVQVREIWVTSSGRRSSKP